MSKVNHRANAASNLLNFDTDRPAKREENSFRRQKAVPRRPAMVRYKFNPTAQAAPNVGETVAVRHRTESLDNGGVKLTRASVETRKIKAVYLSGDDGYSIKDNAGDVWLVRPSAVGGAKWETFVKGELRKENQ